MQVRVDHLFCAFRCGSRSEIAQWDVLAADNVDDFVESLMGKVVRLQPHNFSALDLFSARYTIHEFHIRNHRPYCFQPRRMPAKYDMLHGSVVRELYLRFGIFPGGRVCVVGQRKHQLTKVVQFLLFFLVFYRSLLYGSS